jgi:hypothetical protein
MTKNRIAATLFFSKNYKYFSAKVGNILCNFNTVISAQCKLGERQLVQRQLVQRQLGEFQVVERQVVLWQLVS